MSLTRAFAKKVELFLGEQLLKQLEKDYEKKGIVYFDQDLAHSVAVRRRRSIMLKLNAIKNDLA